MASGALRFAHLAIRLAADGSEIGAGLRGPDGFDPFRRGLIGHPDRLLRPAELTKDLFVRNTFASRERSTGAIQSRGRLGRDLFLFDGSQS